MSFEALPEILIVDDDRSTINLLASILEGMGNLRFATNGEAALERVAQCPPDLVLLDAEMPGMDGFATCSAIRSLPGCSDLPIIFVTVYSSTESETSALALGAVDFIHKPVNPPVVRARVATQLALKQRTDALKIANQNLQSRVGDLQLFSHAASHDLKSPLRTILNFSSLLERDYGAQLAGEGTAYLKFIQGSASRLTRLIDDLLQYAQVDQGQQTIQALDFSLAVQEALAEFQEEIALRQARVEIRLPDTRVQANPSGLAQALRNLIGNALKYTAHATTPLLQLDGEVQAGKLLVQIRDNGIGFDMAHHDRIFAIFHRLHSHGDYQGSGVGLALVKRAVERMGGKVWANSEPGRGACFFLELQAV